MSNWFEINKLFLDIKRSNFIIFISKNKHINNVNLQVKIDLRVSDQVDKRKFLGVILNETLNWNDHMKTITNKVRNIGSILKL